MQNPHYQDAVLGGTNLTLAVLGGEALIRQLIEQINACQTIEEVDAIAKHPQIVPRLKRLYTHAIANCHRPPGCDGRNLRWKMMPLFHLGEKLVRFKKYDKCHTPLSIEMAKCCHARLWQGGTLELDYGAELSDPDVQALSKYLNLRWAEGVAVRQSQHRVLLRDMTKLLLTKLLQGEMFDTTKPEEEPKQLSLF